MGRSLPIAWLGMIPVALLLAGLSMTPLVGSDAQTVMLAKLPGALFSILFILTLTVLYALLHRIGARGLVFGLGWVHLVAFFFTKVGEANFEYLRNQMMISGEPLRAQELAIAGGFSWLASIISISAFLAVVLVAYFDSKPDADPQAFD